MSARKPYHVHGIDFPTQASLEGEIACRKAHHPINKPFQDPFLAEILNTLHVEIQASGQRATGRFELLDEPEKVNRGLGDRPGVPLLLAEFEPSGAWEPVSVTPWRRRRTIEYCRGCIKEALWLLAESYRPMVSPPPRCAEAGCHDGDLGICMAPATWERTAEECLALMAPEEIATRFGFNRYSPGRDDLVQLLPAAHPAVRHLLTRDLGWAWRCSAHRQPAVADLEVRAR